MKGPAPLILVVEDDAATARLLRTILSTAGYRVYEVRTAAEALLQAVGRNPDLVLLDLGLPDGDGLDVLKRLRGWMRAPVLVVTAREREHEKVTVLDAGADDYVTKPFAPAELLARIRVALRHAAMPEHGIQPVFEHGDLKVDLAKRQVWVKGVPVRLTPTEWKLLSMLVRHAGKVMLQGELLREVWGPMDEDHPHYLRVYVANLRRKLEADPARPRYLLTEVGVGYRLAEPA